MQVETVGVVSAGDMGHVVGAVLKKKGLRVLTLLAGRSALTLERAARSGMEDGGDLASLVGQSQVVFSIMPPADARGFAEACAGVMAPLDDKPVFADCNAIAPATAQAIGGAIGGAGGRFVSIGIIGQPPREGARTKFYASGTETDALSFLDGDGILYRPMGPDMAHAKAIKMCYGGLTKARNSLHTLVTTGARLLGVEESFLAELEDSQAPALKDMRRAVPFLACDAGRWVGEMEEIAATFASVGLTGHIHEGAADIFRLLDGTELGAETRETADRSRTLGQALEIYARAAREG